MFVPLHYQISEYDCVPTALANGISYLFERNEVPPMVIRHIYLYCLDTVGKDSRLGIGGTSKYAVRLVGNWLNAYKMKGFSVSTTFLENEQVTIEPDGAIQTCLDEGGVVLCNILLTAREEHYIMVTAMDDEWVYCFDSYRRCAIRGMKEKVKILDSEDGRSPNLKIKKTWFSHAQPSRFCLGPISLRESLLIKRDT